MITGLLGKKLGMTQIFDPDGNFVPVTVVETGPCTVLELKDSPLKVKLGYGDVKESTLNKAKAGYFKKIGMTGKCIVKEFQSSNNEGYKPGQEIKADLFKAGDFVDVSGTSIGKGFQGGMKRHHWMGGPGAHGSMHHRRVGSVGACATPSKIVRGHPMPGHMGHERVTVQGLRVMDVNVEKNYILVKGAVPGPRNSYIEISKSRKKQWLSLEEKKAVVQHKVNPMKQSKAKVGVKKGGGKK